MFTNFLSDYVDLTVCIDNRKALDVLSEILQNLANDYEHLKNTLLSEYQLMSGDFKKSFFIQTKSQ